MTMRAYVGGGLLLAAVLGGCSRSEPEDEAPVENYSSEAPAEPAPVPEARPEPAPAPAANVNEPVRAAPAPEIAPDEQTRDDADATGYTARVSRDDAADQPATENETEAK